MTTGTIFLQVFSVAIYFWFVESLDRAATPQNSLHTLDEIQSWHHLRIL